MAKKVTEKQVPEKPAKKSPKRKTNKKIVCAVTTTTEPNQRRVPVCVSIASQTLL